MKILAFETTDAVASVALYRDGEIFETVIDTDRRHAESVLPAAETLLSAHGLSTADMDAFGILFSYFMKSSFSNSGILTEIQIL